MQVKNSVIVITGAASGIGEAAAVALAAAGANIVLGDINEESLNAVKHRIITDGGNAASKVLNVTDELSVQSFMDFAIAQYSSINVVLACAGIIRDSFLVTPDKDTGMVKKFMTTEQWQQVIDVNMTGVFLTRKSILH